MAKKRSYCPKCQGMMEEGFLRDVMESGQAREGRWVEGAPEKSFWTGLKTRGKRQLPVSALRCVHCGYVELFAIMPEETA